MESILGGNCKDSAMGSGKRGDSEGFWQALFAGIGSAIADIRHKVVEEGWFGRSVTRQPLDPAAGFYRPVLPERPNSFDELWAARERAPAEREQAPEREPPGIDR